MSRNLALTIAFFEQHKAKTLNVILPIVLVMSYTAVEVLSVEDRRSIVRTDSSTSVMFCNDQSPSGKSFFTQSELNRPGFCLRIPSSRGEPPSVSLERINCLGVLATVANFDLPSLRRSSKGKIHAAGLSLPSSSSHSLHNISSTPGSYAARRFACEGYLEELRQLFADLENGRPVSGTVVEHVMNFTPGQYTVLRLVTSARRGRNHANQLMLSRAIRHKKINPKRNFSENSLPLAEHLSDNWGYIYWMF